MRDCIEESHHSFMHESAVVHKEQPGNDGTCAICHSNAPEGLIEICDCSDSEVHLACFKAKFEKSTAIKQTGNCTEVVIEDYGCSKCGKRYESELISFCGMRRRGALYG